VLVYSACIYTRDTSEVNAVSMKSVEDSTVGSARLFALHLPHRLADESGMALWDTTHRHGPNKFPSTTTSLYHNSTACPRAYATNNQVSLTNPGSSRLAVTTRYISAYHGFAAPAISSSSLTVS
jgi:hypothetical protein